MKADYDRIGLGYALRRRADPRVASQILSALKDAGTVVNVGAGTGSYEPKQLSVVAVEPSLEMIRQRPRDAAPVVRARAERLPFAAGRFDAALAILTIHHWQDLPNGLAEMRRVASRRAVILTWDPDSSGAFWLTSHYLPQIVEFDLLRLPRMDELARLLGHIEVRTV